MPPPQVGQGLEPAPPGPVPRPLPVSTLRQPTDRFPHGPPGQLGAALPQPDCLLSEAVPGRTGCPSWLLLGTQALPRLLGLRVCAAPCDGLVMLPVAGPLSEHWNWVYSCLPQSARTPECAAPTKHHLE